MNPRVPSNAIACDAARFELLNDFGQTHIEVASQEIYAELVDVIRQLIPESPEYLRPLAFHGHEISMDSTHHDAFPKMANVLFEGNLAHQ